MQIPAELEKHFIVLDHDLPGRDQLEQIARGIATEDGDLPQGDDLNMVLDAAAGLTRYEAEGAYSLEHRAAWQHPARRDLGTEVPNAKEKRPPATPSRRRAVRWPGRAAIAQELLPYERCGVKAIEIRCGVHAGFCCSGSRARASLRSPRPLEPKRAGRR